MTEKEKKLKGMKQIAKRVQLMKLLALDISEPAKMEAEVNDALLDLQINMGANIEDVRIDIEHSCAHIRYETIKLVPNPDYDPSYIV